MRITIAYAVFGACGAMAQTEWPRVYVGNLVARAAVTASLDGATRRLRDPSCSRSLSHTLGLPSHTYEDEDVTELMLCRR
jgi:hypothetical protein